jgi:hypothetical protein
MSFPFNLTKQRVKFKLYTEILKDNVLYLCR